MADTRQEVQSPEARILIGEKKGRIQGKLDIIEIALDLAAGGNLALVDQAQTLIQDVKELLSTDWVY